MGLMDNMKDKLGDMDDAMSERLSLLKHKEQNGELTDSDREELQQLLARVKNHDNPA